MEQNFPIQSNWVATGLCLSFFSVLIVNSVTLHAIISLARRNSSPLERNIGARGEGSRAAYVPTASCTYAQTHTRTRTPTSFSSPSSGDELGSWPSGELTCCESGEEGAQWPTGRHSKGEAGERDKFLARASRSPIGTIRAEVWRVETRTTAGSAREIKMHRNWEEESTFGRRQPPVARH